MPAVEAGLGPGQFVIEMEVVGPRQVPLVIGLTPGGRVGEIERAVEQHDIVGALTKQLVQLGGGDQWSRHCGEHGVWRWPPCYTGGSISAVSRVGGACAGGTGQVPSGRPP